MLLRELLMQKKKNKPVKKRPEYFKELANDASSLHFPISNHVEKSINLFLGALFFLKMKKRSKIL